MVRPRWTSIGRKTNIPMSPRETIVVKHTTACQMTNSTRGFARLREKRADHRQRMRRQGIRRERNDHPAQEAPNGELREGVKNADRRVNRIRQAIERTTPPTSRPGGSAAPTTAVPRMHSSRQSPQHSRSASSKPLLNNLPGPSVTISTSPPFHCAGEQRNSRPPPRGAILAIPAITLSDPGAPATPGGGRRRPRPR